MTMLKEKNYLDKTRSLEIIEQLGIGAFSHVYHCRDMNGDDHVVKVVDPKKITGDALQLFLTEAGILKSLQEKHHHTHIVRYTGVRNIDLMKSGQFRHIITLEYLKGSTIGNLLSKASEDGISSFFNLTQVYQISLQLLSALDFLHTKTKKPILHRDIKPDNLFLTPNRGVVLIDFNVSKRMDSTAGPPTQYVGTRGYQPPEVVMGHEWTVPGEIYSIGIVLLEMLEGKITEQDIELPEDKRYSAQERQKVKQILQKAMNENPLERYASA